MLVLAQQLLLAFLLISLRPTHPYMVLLLSGGHGSGKSKISELIKRIIDPNALEKFRLPKDEHTLAIQTTLAWLLVYDNTSAVRWDLSDALCAMLTGGGFNTRKYYTDDERRMFKNARPAIINNIGEFASQHDLLDPAIAIKLPPIPEGTRRTDKAINARFEAILPGVLRCLFDIVSVALRRFDDVEPPPPSGWRMPLNGSSPPSRQRACRKARSCGHSRPASGRSPSRTQSTIPLLCRHSSSCWKPSVRSAPIRERWAIFMNGCGPAWQARSATAATASHLSNVLQRLLPAMVC